MVKNYRQKTTRRHEDNNKKSILQAGAMDEWQEAEKHNETIFIITLRHMQSSSDGRSAQIIYLSNTTA